VADSGGMVAFGVLGRPLPEPSMPDFDAAEPAAAPCLAGGPALAERTRPIPAITATAAAHTATATVTAIRRPRRRPPRAAV